MLPKSNRLANSHEIAAVRSTGARISGTYVNCFVIKTNAQTQARFSFIVSKRISKLAVARNRTKRLLREAVYSMLASIQPGTTVVCLAKTDLSEVPLQKIAADLMTIFTKASILQS